MNLSVYYLMKKWVKYDLLKYHALVNGYKLSYYQYMKALKQTPYFLASIIML